MSKLYEVKALAAEISASLPMKLDAHDLSHKSNVPFKAFTVRELCIHRVSDFANGAITLLEQERAAPALTLIRSVQESFALLYSLHRKTATFLEAKVLPDYDEYLMKCLVGSKSDPDTFEAINVLTNIGHFEKVVPGFRGIYDSLCEYAHPNWSGLLLSYGVTDSERHVTTFGTNMRPATVGIGLAALNSNLLLAAHYYNKLGDELMLVNEYFNRT